MSINIDGITKAIVKELATYTSEVKEGIETAQDEIAKDGVKELKKKSPKRYGKYGKGWGKVKRGTATVVRNKQYYMLTHLLENGHALATGGRSPAYPHIGPVEDMMVKKFQEEVIKAVEKR